MPRVYVVVHDADRHELERGQLIRMTKESATSDSITYGLRDDHSSALASQLLAPLSPHRLSRPCLSVVMVEDAYAGEHDGAPKVDPSFEEAYNEGVELVDEHVLSYAKDAPNGKDSTFALDPRDGSRGQITFSGDGRRVLSLVYLCPFASLMAAVDMHETPDDDDTFPGEVREALLEAMNLVSVTERTAAFIGASLNVPAMELIGPKKGRKKKRSSSSGRKNKSRRKSGRKGRKKKKTGKKYKRRQKKQRNRKKKTKKPKKPKKPKVPTKPKKPKKPKKPSNSGEQSNSTGGGASGGGRNNGGDSNGGGGKPEGGAPPQGGEQGRVQPQPFEPQTGGGGGGGLGGGGFGGNFTDSAGNNPSGPVFSGGGPPIVINQSTPTPIFVPVPNTVPPPGTVVYILPAGAAAPPGATTVLLPPGQQAPAGSTTVYLPAGTPPPAAATTTTIVSAEPPPPAAAAAGGIVDNVISIESLRIGTSILSHHFVSEVERHLVTALHHVWNDQAWKHYVIPYPRELDSRFRQMIRAALPMRSTEEAEDLLLALVETLNERMVSDIVAKVRSGTVPPTFAAGDAMSSDDSGSASDGSASESEDSSSGGDADSGVESVKPVGDRWDRDRYLRREEWRRRHDPSYPYGYYPYYYATPPPVAYGPPASGVGFYAGVPGLSVSPGAGAPPTYPIAASKEDDAVVVVGMARESEIEAALRRVEDLAADPKGFDPLLEDAAPGTVPYAVYASERERQLASTLGLSSWQTLGGEPGWNAGRQERLDKAMRVLYGHSERTRKLR